ncbi:MAG: hypothetical protein K2F79_07330 [Muribaculaceae bacterium]|nr:hypothetical protein [Muribaculaceae bacterium]
MTTRLLLSDYFRRASRAAMVYDPHSGIGSCGRRVSVSSPVPGLPRALVPVTMTDDPQYQLARGNCDAWRRLRCRHDFEYWAANCATIKHKTEARDVPFVLNTPQRRVLSCLEADRLAGRPIRLILLKARQWGGSTLVQMYMAWIQSCHRSNWHSLICAHVKDTSAALRGMYSKLLANYPEELWEGDEKPEFRGFERSVNIREIRGRGCRVTIGSSENQDAVRGSDYAMAHLSETAFWPSSPTRTPENFIRAVCGAISLQPYTLIAVESTANGVGNFFHNEWQRCRNGRGDKLPVFVPWHEIEFNRYAPSRRQDLAGTLSDDERSLWDCGLDLDQICWYRLKRSEYSSADQMAAEFPATDTEAFLATGAGVFGHNQIETLRADCSVTPRRGEIDEAGFTEDSSGELSVWAPPAEGVPYVVAVDVGGRTWRADWSVIAVMACPYGGRREIVAQWRGHIDHDLLASKAIAIARHYGHALLAIESNTLESGCGADADPNLFVLTRMARDYPNMYMRQSYDSASRQHSMRIGFHTNRATKSLLIGGLIEAVRRHSYIERDPMACDELATYEQRPSGAYAAKEGKHDDILMTRAIALHVASEQIPDAPVTLPLPARRAW